MQQLQQEMIQHRSDMRTGEPADHKKAKEFIGTLLKWSGFDTHYEYPLVDPMMYPNYRHNYDVVGFKELIVVEIDDPNLHSKPKKKINDEIAKFNVKSLFPRSSLFIRLNKDEINSEDTMYEYLQGSFWPYIK